MANPQAMYRNVNGAEWFQGIVTAFNTLGMFKFDDPTKVELIGSGHFMDDNEFFTESFHCDNFFVTPGHPTHCQNEAEVTHGL